LAVKRDATVELPSAGAYHLVNKQQATTTTTTTRTATTDRYESVDDVSADGKALVERPGSDERASQLDTELLRHVAKWRQITCAGDHAGDVAVIKRVLGVHQPEHSHQQSAEERLQCSAKVHVRAFNHSPTSGYVKGNEWPHHCRLGVRKSIRPVDIE